jgi:hypothetical protein
MISLNCFFQNVEKAQSTIFYLNSELGNLQESANTSERLSGELSQLQRQTVLMGEMFLKHKEQLEKLPVFAQREEEELCKIDESCKKEVKGLLLKEMFPIHQTNS